MRKISVVFYGGLIALGFMGAHPAFAQKKSVAEEILEILRANGQISDQQYRDLLNKARAEGEARQAASEAVAQGLQAPKDTKAKPGVKIGYRVGRGIHFESSDGNYALYMGGRVQTQWNYTDHDGEASGKSDESEFRLRRARIWWRGHVYDPRIKYYLQLDAADGEVEFLDWEFNYQYMPQLGIQFGQFKPGQSRQELGSSGTFQFVERSLANDFFNIGRDRGIELTGGFADDLLTYRLGVFNGNGLNARQSSTDYLYAGRIQLDPLGAFPDGEAEIDNIPHPRISFGVSSQYNKVGKKDISNLSTDNDALEFFVIKPKFSGDNIDVWTSTADAAFKWRGFSLVGEYYYGDVNTDLTFDFCSGTTNKNFNAYGWYVQSGYFLIPSLLEVAFRYSVVDPEDNALNFTKQDEVRGALSYYFWKHNLKVQADIGKLGTERRGRSDIDDLQYRIQAQLIF